MWKAAILLFLQIIYRQQHKLTCEIGSLKINFRAKIEKPVRTERINSNKTRKSSQFERALKVLNFLQQTGEGNSPLQ